VLGFTGGSRRIIQRGIASNRGALFVEIGIAIEIGEGFDIAAVSDPDFDSDRTRSRCTATSLTHPQKCRSLNDL
jgi:hypothetical protein